MVPIVFSSSAIAAFKRCPKSYQFGYEMMLEPPPFTKKSEAGTVKDYVYMGSEIHAEFEGAADNDVLPGKGRALSIDVAETYLRHFPLPPNILSADKPAYTKLLAPQGSPEVYVRTTFDLVYEKGDGTIVGRDYKTFEKAPTLDLDLDFQGRIYVAALARKYPGHPIEFEYEYVRRVPPGTKNSKGFWTPQDCYLNFPLVISKREADEVWRETQWVAEAMLRTKESGHYWRTDLKGASPFTCGSCFYKNICKAELEHGELDESALAILAPTRKKPMQLPEELANHLLT